MPERRGGVRRGERSNSRSPLRRDRDRDQDRDQDRQEHFRERDRGRRKSRSRSWRGGDAVEESASREEKEKKEKKAKRSGWDELPPRSVGGEPAEAVAPNMAAAAAAAAASIFGGTQPGSGALVQTGIPDSAIAAAAEAAMAAAMATCNKSGPAPASDGVFKPLQRPAFRKPGQPEPLRIVRSPIPLLPGALDRPALPIMQVGSQSHLMKQFSGASPRAPGALLAQHPVQPKLPPVRPSVTAAIASGRIAGVAGGLLGGLAQSAGALRPLMQMRPLMRPYLGKTASTTPSLTMYSSMSKAAPVAATAAAAAMPAKLIPAVAKGASTTFAAVDGGIPVSAGTPVGMDLEEFSDLVSPALAALMQGM